MHERREETVRNCRGPQPARGRPQTGARVSGDPHVWPCPQPTRRHPTGHASGAPAGPRAKKRGRRAPAGLAGSTTWSARHAQPTNDPSGSMLERNGPPRHHAPKCGAPRRAAPKGWRRKTAGTRGRSLGTNASQGLTLLNLESGFHQRGSDNQPLRAKPHLGWLPRAAVNCCITICLDLAGHPAVTTS